MNMILNLFFWIRISPDADLVSKQRESRIYIRWTIHWWIDLTYLPIECTKFNMYERGIRPEDRGVLQIRNVECPTRLESSRYIWWLWYAREGRANIARRRCCSCYTWLWREPIRQQQQYKKDLQISFLEFLCIKLSCYKRSRRVSVIEVNLDSFDKLAFSVNCWSSNHF